MRESAVLKRCLDFLGHSAFADSLEAKALTSDLNQAASRLKCKERLDVMRITTCPGRVSIDTQAGAENLVTGATSSRRLRLTCAIHDFAQVTCAIHDFALEFPLGLVLPYSTRLLRAFPEIVVPFLMGLPCYPPPIGLPISRLWPRLNRH